MYARARDRRYTSPDAPRARCVRKYSTAQASSRAPRRPRAREDHHPLTIHPFTHSLTYPLSPKTHSFLHTQSTQYEYDCTATEEVRIRTRTHCIHRGSYLHVQYIHTSYPPLSLPSESHTRANSKPTARRETLDARRKMRDANREKVLLTTMPSRRGPLEAPPPGERARPIW